MAGAFIKGTMIGPGLGRWWGHRPVKCWDRDVMFLVGGIAAGFGA